MYGLRVDCGVGGGASIVLATVLRAVGESASPTALGVVRLQNDVTTGGKAVCRESFGLLEVDGCGGGITESMVPATCFRSSEVAGDSDRFDLEGNRVLA